METIYQYTRQQALEDGVLVNVTQRASKLFNVPVALTQALFADMEPDSEVFNMRLRNLLLAVAQAATGAHDDRVQILFELRNRTRVVMGRLGPGDNGEPAMTIGFPTDF